MPLNSSKSPHLGRALGRTSRRGHLLYLLRRQRCVVAHFSRDLHRRKVGVGWNHRSLHLHPHLHKPLLLLLVVTHLRWSRLGHRPFEAARSPLALHHQPNQKKDDWDNVGDYLRWQNLKVRAALPPLSLPPPHNQLPKAHDAHAHAYLLRLLLGMPHSTNTNCWWDVMLRLSPSQRFLIRDEMILIRL